MAGGDSKGGGESPEAVAGERAELKNSARHQLRNPVGGRDAPSASGFDRPRTSRRPHPRTIYPFSTDERDSAGPSEAGGEPVVDPDIPIRDPGLNLSGRFVRSAPVARLVARLPEEATAVLGGSSKRSSSASCEAMNSSSAEMDDVAAFMPVIRGVLGPIPLGARSRGPLGWLLECLPPSLARARLRCFAAYSSCACALPFVCVAVLRTPAGVRAILLAP